MRSLLLLVPIALLCVGCGGRASERSPDAMMDGFANALREARHEEAYNRLSVQYRSRVSFEEFRRHLQEHPDEARELAGLLANREGPAEVTAEVQYTETDRVSLVQENGRWRIHGNVVEFYSQSSPRVALRSFIRAMQRRRYDVVMRFVPRADLDGMSEDQMRAAWEGEGREEVDRLIANLTSFLDNPIEEVGDRATMAYGDRFSVRFVREDSVWKIEDPD